MYLEWVEFIAGRKVPSVWLFCTHEAVRTFSDRDKRVPMLVIPDRFSSWLELLSFPCALWQASYVDYSSFVLLPSPFALSFRSLDPQPDSVGGCQNQQRTQMTSCPLSATCELLSCGLLKRREYLGEKLLMARGRSALS